MGHPTKSLENKLSINELRNYNGCENLSDQELQILSDSILELSLLLYEVFSTELQVGEFVSNVQKEEKLSKEIAVSVK